MSDFLSFEGFKQKIWVVLTIVLSLWFLGKSWVYIQNDGGRPHFSAATSEALQFGAARWWVENGGMSATFGLPVYEGFISEGPMREHLDKTRVYTHYFAGTEYYSYLFYKIFGVGERAVAASRVLPALFLLLAVLIFARVGASVLWPEFKPGVFVLSAALITAPAVYQFGVSVRGLGVTMGLVLLAAAVGIRYAQGKWKGFWPNFAAFWIGFAVILTHFEQVFICIAAPFIAALWLTPTLPVPAKRIFARWFSIPRRRGLWITLIVGLGVFASFWVHFLQVALYFESLNLAFLDQFGTLLMRSEARATVPPRIQIFGMFSTQTLNHFRWTALSMALFSGFLVTLLPTSRERRLQYWTAIVVSVIAGSLWFLALPVHSTVHDTWQPRSFIMLYLTFVVIAVEAFRLSHRQSPTV